MVVGVTFPIHLNEPVKHLVKWVHRRVSRRFEPDGNRRRKLIAMAQECASTLQIDNWNLVPWDPLHVTMDMLEILAASKECSTPEGAAQIAWLLGETDIVFWEAYNRFFHDGDYRAETDLYKVDVNVLKKYQEKVKDIIGEWSGESVIEVLDDAFQLQYPFPLKKHLPESLHSEIAIELDNALDYVRNLNKEHGKTLFSPDDYDKSGVFEATFYVALMLRFGFSLASVDEAWEGSAFLASCYVQEYVAFLLQILQSTSDVGKMTNFSKLRSIHVSNCSPAAHGKKAWDVFIALVENRERPISSQSMSMQRPATIPDTDLFDVMRRTLGGQLRIVDGIQVSIADSLLGVKEVGKNTFSGRISRRKVQLLRCGNDDALVLPYLNTIILQLNDDKWVRDFDVEALQPCCGVQKYEGSIRRAATVLLAFDYPKFGEPVINEVANRIIYQHARKGELFSKNLREKLLAVKGIEHRVDIRALADRASEVFKDEKDKVAALTREMAHDVLVTRSYFKEESKTTKDGGPNESRSLTQLTCDDDAYYDTFYRKGGFKVRNNILCINGVPLLGLRTDYTLTRAGQLGGQEMHGVAILRRYDGDKVVVWIPARKSRENDNEVATGFIENRECVDGKVIEPLPTAVPNNGPTFDNFRLGGYCRFDVDIGAPPEKRRKKAGPSSQVEVDGIQLLLDAMKVSNR